MKYLLILADGLADEPIAALGHKTPLQYAATPNIDFLAQTAYIGTARTIPQGFPPGSDVVTCRLWAMIPGFIIPAAALWRPSAWEYPWGCGPGFAL